MSARTAVSQTWNTVNTKYPATSFVLILGIIAFIAIQVCFITIIELAGASLGLKIAFNIMLTMFTWGVLVLIFSMSLSFGWNINYTLLGEIGKEIFEQRHSAPLSVLLTKCIDYWIGVIINIILIIPYLVYFIIIHPLIKLTKFSIKKIRKPASR